MMPKEPGQVVFLKSVRCRELLEAFCAERGVSVADIQGKSRNAQLVIARRDFCRFANANGIGSVLTGKAIHRSAWTVQYHVNPAIRARRDKYNTNHRAAGRCIQALLGMSK
jgi:hypothetical protein